MKEAQIPVALPENLVLRVDALVDTMPELGFRSRGEFVVNAVREFVGRQEENAFRALELRGKLPKSVRPRTPSGRKRVKKDARALLEE